MKIEFNDKEIDVKDLMRQIKANLSNRGYKKETFELPRESSYNFTDIEEHHYILNRIWGYSPDSPIFSHRRFIGKIIVFFKKVIRKMLRWYISPIVEKQIDFNANAVRMFNSMVDLMKQMENSRNKDSASINIKEMLQEVAAEREQNNQQTERYEILFERIDKLEEANEELTQKLQEANEELAQKLQEAHNEMTERMVSLQNQWAEQALDSDHRLDVLRMNTEQNDERIAHELRSSSDVLSSELRGIREQTNQWTSSARISAERLRRIERNVRKVSMLQSTSVLPTVEANDSESQEDSLDFDYFLFEEYYRGTREQIKEKQKHYLQYFNNGSKVLDLGCGRGEFTELLLEQGILVTSVDLNDDMVSFCQERGFPIIQSDILKYLRTMDDGSVDGIFLSHVIEHLGTGQLIELIKLSHQKLKPTGWFIAETPNPQTMSVFTQSFYMDPTHIKPVHPLTLKFICETAGFVKSEVNYMSPNDAYLQLPKLEANGLPIGNLDLFNETIEHWNRIIFGCQDYYIASQK
ncbi:methyltransferase domain-containing protein [Paenibacillus hodogayensis]|uniref:Methyltransferase domain-containing protein n=1 Tax=Paenibacillus hodogayensis TaxID=279208 RepID=A0ABV5VRZ4_9BACL